MANSVAWQQARLVLAVGHHSSNGMRAHDAMMVAAKFEVSPCGAIARVAAEAC